MIMSIMSGKGGTGKDTIVSNLSYYLSTITSNNIILFDLDFGCNDLQYYFGVQPDSSLVSYLKDECELSDVMYNLCNNLWLVSGKQGDLDLANIGNYKYNINKLVKGIRNYKDTSDIVFLNLAAGIGNSVLEFANLSDGVIAVITPDISSITDGYHAIKDLMQMGYDAETVYLLVNQVQDKSTKKASETANNIYNRINTVLKKNIGKEIKNIGYVRMSSNVQKALVSRQPFVKMYPKTEATRHIMKIANVLFNPGGNSSGNK